ncbi:S26 family signal peptidase [bacterium]|nr:S26 family signal peptidase [bacterium]
MTTATDETPASIRPTIEFVLVLVMATSLFKLFVVDGYFVPTGSMAPGLLGVHQNLTCPSCGYRFAVGHEPAGWSPPTLPCPSCKKGTIPFSDPIVQPGDRLLVLKGFFEFFEPRRWETAVFLNPNDAGAAYVKRIVGLPGEKIVVRQGDVYANDQIQRKTFQQYRSVAIPVYNTRPGIAVPPTLTTRWLIDQEGKATLQETNSGWMIRAPGRQDLFQAAYQETDGTGQPVPIRDDLAYNASRLSSAPVAITDLSVRWIFRWKSGDGAMVVHLTPAMMQSFTLTIRPARGTIECSLSQATEGLAKHPFSAGQPVEMEFGFWDAQVMLAIDGRVLARFAVDPLPAGSEPTLHPVEIKMREIVGEIEQLQIFRDIYYRRDASRSWTARQGDGYLLGPDEYFMMGDNTAVSNDSRSWDVPGIARRMLVGKPIVVHLPMWSGRGKIAGRTWHWNLPDVTRMRRIDAW